MRVRRRTRRKERVDVAKNIPLAKLGQLYITALEAERVSNTRNYRMLTAAWIVAPWELRKPSHKRAS